MKTIKNNNTTHCSDCGPHMIYPDHYAVVIVQTLVERNQLACSLRQNGMIAIVVEEGYAEYQIQNHNGLFDICDNRAWVKLTDGDSLRPLGVWSTPTEI